MTALTQDEVRELLEDIGMKPRTARIGSAIALCESPLPPDNGVFYSDFDAIGDIELANDVWGYSYGGFQIRSKQDETGTGGWRDADRLLTPRFNCRAANAIRKAAGGWTPWSTYNSGMYRAYLQEMYPPDPGTHVVVYGETLSGIADNIGGFTWQELARVNGIHTPYVISIGQTLVLP